MKLKRRGFAIRPQRLIEEHISGSVVASERPGFIRLLDRMGKWYKAIVSKLDRLGRNAMDIRKTVEQLAASDIRVHCLALGGVDLTSPAGKNDHAGHLCCGRILKGICFLSVRTLVVWRAKSCRKRFGRPSTLE